MTEDRTRRDAERIMLPGSRVQYSSREVVVSSPFDLEEVLVDFVKLRESARAEFLSIFAHSLTVEIRVALLDRPVSGEEADRAYRVNEWLHQLTSCLNPRNRRGANGEAELIRDIALESLEHELEGGVGRAVRAAKNAIVRVRESAPAIDG